MDRNEMSTLYRGLPIDASYQVSVHLASEISVFKMQLSLQISKTTSPLKPLGQMNRNLVGSIYGRSSVKIAHFVPIR
jgi:hypothetical protein